MLDVTTNDKKSVYTIKSTQFFLFVVTSGGVVVGKFETFLYQLN